MLLSQSASSSSLASRAFLGGQRSRAVATAASKAVATRHPHCPHRLVQRRAAASTLTQQHQAPQQACHNMQPLSQPAIVERRPSYHFAPERGWINDPNGPLLHNGTYHLFYQHVPNSLEWRWGLVWGHAKSQDLVNWQHLPIALEPTPNGLDQHGCFSGCATIDVDGRPALLYTGVIRKEPNQIREGISPQFEEQLIAVATDLDDPDLTHWQKLPGSFLPRPPADMDLTGWRDPFVLERPSAASPWWYVMVGAGLHRRCGTALVYRSKDLTEGWQYVGPLCESTSSFMWECPTMATLSNNASTPSNGNNGSSNGSSHAPKQRHMLSVSPDYCVNGIQYWLGDYAEGRFDMQAADGPFALDLGDVLYAPNLLTDKQGRTVLWAWMQEKDHMRPAAAAAGVPNNSACCLCVPRLLCLSTDGTMLLQEPLPELSQLRQQQGAWHAGAAAANGSYSNGSSNGSSSGQGVVLAPGQRMQLGGSNDRFDSSSSVDIELRVSKGGADSFALLLQPFEGDGGRVGAEGAAITYCWATNTLQVVYTTDLATLKRVAALPLQPRPHYTQPGPDPRELAAAEAAAAEPGMPLRCGGALRAPAAAGSGAPPAPAWSGAAAGGGDDDDAVLSLRILLDGSCLEVFTSTGEALGTRVYRGDEAVTTLAGSAQQQQQQAPHVRTPGAEAEAAASALDSTLASAAAAGAVGWEQMFSGADNSSSGGDSESTAAGGSLSGGQLELVAFGDGPAHLISGSAWHMSNMWHKHHADEQTVAASSAAAAVSSPLPVAAAASAAVTAAAAAAEVLQGLVAATEATTAVAAAAASAAAAPVVLPVGRLTIDGSAAAGGVTGVTGIATSAGGGGEGMSVAGPAEVLVVPLSPSGAAGGGAALQQPVQAA